MAIDEERFNFPENLPADLAFLKNIDWTPIHPKLFDGSMDLLCERLRSVPAKHSLYKFITMGALLSLLAVILSLTCYIFGPVKSIDVELEQDDDYIVSIPKEFDYDFYDEMEDYYWSTPLGDAYTLLFSQISTSTKFLACNAFIEDFEMYDVDDFNGILNDEMFAKVIDKMTNCSLQELGENTITSLKAEDSKLTVKGNPTYYSTSFYQWIIYHIEYSDRDMYICCTRNTELVVTHVRMTIPKTNKIKQWRYMHKLKVLLDNLSPQLYYYILEEFM